MTMKNVKSILQSCIPFVIAILLLAFILTSLGNLGRGSLNEERDHLEEAIRRAALSCYASKGYYPPDMEYIVYRYGIQIDHDNFAVFYDAYAENLMPQIDVVIKHE